MKLKYFFSKAGINIKELNLDIQILSLCRLKSSKFNGFDMGWFGNDDSESTPTYSSAYDTLKNALDTNAGCAAVKNARSTLNGISAPSPAASAQRRALLDRADMYILENNC